MAIKEEVGQHENRLSRPVLHLICRHFVLLLNTYAKCFQFRRYFLNTSTIMIPQAPQPNPTAAFRCLQPFDLDGSIINQSLFNTVIPGAVQGYFLLALKTAPPNSLCVNMICLAALCCGPGDEVEMIAASGCRFFFVCVCWVWVFLLHFFFFCHYRCCSSLQGMIKDTSTRHQGGVFTVIPEVPKLDVFIYTSPSSFPPL